MMLSSPNHTGILLPNGAQLCVALPHPFASFAEYVVEDMLRGLKMRWDTKEVYGMLE